MIYSALFTDLPEILILYSMYSVNLCHTMVNSPPQKQMKSRARNKPNNTKNPNYVHVVGLQENKSVYLKQKKLCMLKDFIRGILLILHRINVESSLLSESPIQLDHSLEVFTCCTEDLSPRRDNQTSQAPKVPKQGT